MKWSIVSSDDGLAGVQDFREIGVTSFDELDLWMTRLREREHLFIRVRCLKPPSMPRGVEDHVWYAERGERAPLCKGDS